MASFYTYFSSAIGTMLMLAFFISLLGQKHLDLGLFGLLGFPVLAMLYALARKVSSADTLAQAVKSRSELDAVYQHPEYRAFLEEDPERRYIYKEDLSDSFAEWLSSRK